MRTDQRFPLFVSSFSLGLAAPALAQDAQPIDGAARADDARPAIEQAAGAAEVPAARANAATVVKVVGMVQVRNDADESWSRAQIGQVVPPGGEFRTGPRSWCQVRIGGGQLMTIDRLGVIKLEEALNINGVDTTTLDMDYGRFKFDVDSKRFENDLTVKSPVATLAVRGTVSLMDGTGKQLIIQGGQDNQSTFEVNYGYFVAQLDQNDGTTPQNPNPAQKREQGMQFFSFDERVLENDEKQLIERTPGGGQPERGGGPAAGGGGPTPPPAPLIRQAFLPPAPPAQGPPAFVPQPPPGAPPAPTPPMTDPPVDDAPLPPDEPPATQEPNIVAPVPNLGELLLADAAAESLNLRPLAQALPSRLGPINERSLGALPAALTAADRVGGLAARSSAGPAGEVDVFLLVGGDPVGSIFGTGQAVNEVYQRTLVYDSELGRYVVATDWSGPIVDLSPGSIGQPIDAEPFQGLATLQRRLFTSRPTETPSPFDFPFRKGLGDLDFAGGEIWELRRGPTGGQATLNMRFPDSVDGPGANKGGADRALLGGLDFHKGMALDGVDADGSIYWATAGGRFWLDTDGPPTQQPPNGEWISQFQTGVSFETIVWDYDPRSQFLGSQLFSAAPGSFATDDFFIDGLAVQGDTLTLTRQTPSPDKAGTFDREFITLDASTGQVTTIVDVEPGSASGSARRLLGLAGPNYVRIAPSPVLAPAPADVDFASIDPVFGQLAFDLGVITFQMPVAGNAGATFATPFAALYTLHLLDTSLDPYAAAFSSRLDGVPGALQANANTRSGVAAATADIRFALPPGHPLSGAIPTSAPALDLHYAGASIQQDDLKSEGSGVFAELLRRDFRFAGGQFSMDLGEISGDLSDEYGTSSGIDDLGEGGVLGGLTSRGDAGPEGKSLASVDGDVYRLLYGGYDSGGFATGQANVWNEVYELDAEGDGGWTFLGKFVFQEDGAGNLGANLADDAGDRGELFRMVSGPVLTGLASFGDQASGITDYAIDQRGQVFALEYEEGPAEFRSGGGLSRVADFRWADSGGEFERTAPAALASAESRGSLFAVGEYAGTNAPSPNVDGTTNNPLDELVIYEFDPRNRLIKNTWWGFAGDFQTTDATTRGTLDLGDSATPEQVAQIHGAAFVPNRLRDGGGTLAVHGEFRFESGRGGGETASGVLSFDLDADGPQNAGLISSDPYLMRFDSAARPGFSQGDAFDRPLGLATSADGQGAAPPPAVLSIAPPIDLSGVAQAGARNGFVGIPADFAALGYTEDALRSDVLQQVMAYQFAHDGNERFDASQCRIDLLYQVGGLRDRLDAAFDAHIGQASGLGSVYSDLSTDPVINSPTSTCRLSAGGQ